MKIELLLIIGAFVLALVHPEATQVAATATLLLLVTRIERGRRARKKKSASAARWGA
jgi:hypothetical protein